MDVFRAVLESEKGGGGKKVPLPKICDTYPTVMKLVTTVSYLERIQKK